MIRSSNKKKQFFLTQKHQPMQNRQAGPKLFVFDEETIHNQLILQGLDQSVRLPNSPLPQQNSLESKTNGMKSETENFTRSALKECPLKEKSFFREMQKVKFVKLAIKKLINFNTFRFVQKLRKINYQIIGDKAKEFSKGSSLQVFFPSFLTQIFFSLEIFPPALFPRRMEEDPDSRPESQI